MLGRAGLLWRKILPKFIVAALLQIEPAFADKISLLNDEKLEKYDAVIATARRRVTLTSS